MNCQMLVHDDGMILGKSGDCLQHFYVNYSVVLASPCRRKYVCLVNMQVLRDSTVLAMQRYAMT